MNGVVPRLDSQLADIRLECLQLAHKLSPGIGLDAEDIVKAAATFSRYVIDGVQACPQDAPAPAADADSAGEIAAMVETNQQLRDGIGEILRILDDQIAILRGRKAQLRAQAEAGGHLDPAR